MNYILLLLMITGCPNIDNPKTILSQKKIDIFLQVNFKNKYKFQFSYLDSSYRNSSVEFVNNKQGDTIIFRKITTDKPTVFTYNEVINNRIYQQQFIGFNNDDTISFEMNNNKLSYVGKDKRNYIVNELFGKTDVILKNKEFSIQEFTNQQDMVEDNRTKQFNALTNLLSLYPIDTYSVNTIKYLINLSYFNDIFNINFSGAIQKNWENPYFNKFDSFYKKTKILDSITSQYTNSILYHLIQYGAYLNKSQQTEVLENIQYLNPRFHKTKYLDGLILNLMDYQIKTYDGRKRVLAKLKNYMIDNSDPIKYTKKQINNKVFNSSLLSFQDKQVTFKDLLNVKEKIIVFDFWASWCVPCLGEIPDLKSKSKKLTDVKFISISLDKVSSDWLVACNKYDIKSNSYRIMNVSTNELLKYFDIRSIPRFIVMTNKGEILSGDFFKPSNSNFEIDLKRILDVYK
jgi:thiol-disulfide isomerase/thioredoxin